MATLKSKRKQELEVKDMVAQETQSEETSKYLNEYEKSALSEQHEKDVEESKRVSTKKMEKAVEIVQNTFNLASGSFVVNGFADKGNKCQLSLSNDDFDLVISVKDTEKFGII